MTDTKPTLTLNDFIAYAQQLVNDGRYQEYGKGILASLKELAAIRSQPVPVAEVHVILDGPPSHESGRFVECEDADGKSINVGRWEQRGKYWHLIINTTPQSGVREVNTDTVSVPKNEHSALMYLLDAAEAEPHATPRLVNGVLGYYLYKHANAQ